MHLLVLSDRPGGARALLPSLEYLDHTIQDIGLEDRKSTRLNSSH